MDLKNTTKFSEFSQSQPSSLTFTMNPITTNQQSTNLNKIENKYRNSKIQKQISLYEKESQSLVESKNLTNDIPKLSKRRIGTVEPPNFITSDDLEKSFTTNIEKNLSNLNFDHEKDKCTKTKSCVNLKSMVAPPHSPGAVVIRESFIEPPKRIAKSFHGKTQFYNLEARRSNSDSTQPGQAFTFSSNGDSEFKKNSYPLQRQFSTPNQISNSLNLSNRFKTTVVRELGPSQSVDEGSLDYNNYGLAEPPSKSLNIDNLKLDDNN